MKIQHWLVVLFILVMGCGTFLYRVLVLEIPVVPDFKSSKTIVEAHILFETENQPSTISIFLPRISSRYEILDEQFISNGFALATEVKKGNRLAHWSRAKSSKRYELFYRALVSPNSKTNNSYQNGMKKPVLRKVKLGKKALKRANTFVSRIPYDSRDQKLFVLNLLSECFSRTPTALARKVCAGTKTEEASLKAVSELLALKKIPSQVAHGISILKHDRRSQVMHWLEVFIDDKWQSFNQRTQKAEIPEHYLKWWAGSSDFVRTDGVNLIEANLSVTRSEGIATSAAVKRAEKKSDSLGLISLSHLPVESQAVYRLVLLIPFGALVVCFVRNVIGLNTLGTFMPVLIALSFRETGLLGGIAFYSLLVFMGLIFRYFFEKLQLLLIPRLTATLTVVIILMLSVSLFMEYNQITKGFSVALFPLVILTMTIERMSVVAEELGFLKAMRQGIVSMLVAALIYLIITNRYLEYWFFVYPELLLVNLALAIMLGRYTGYRLLELIRFKNMLPTSK